MTIEAMKAIKMVYANTTEHDWPDDIWDAICQAIEAEKHEVSQEPVAWMYTSHYKGDERYITKYQFDLSTYKADKVWPLYTTPQPKRDPLTDWVSVDDRLPDDGGYYLVTVSTDDEPHVDVLLFDAKRKHWEHEGEPTFCHSYYFEPTHWAVRPEAANAIKG